LVAAPSRWPYSSWVRRLAPFLNDAAEVEARVPPSAAVVRASQVRAGAAAPACPVPHVVAQADRA